MRALLLLAALAAQSQAPDILREFDRAGERHLWPGFEPKAIPLAIYDGQRTYIYRHPTLGTTTVNGQHAEVRANTSTKLAGATTATLMVNPHLSTGENAAILLHETFHVFQGARYPSWAPNEAAYFTYPVEDTHALAIAIAESDALRRALENPQQTGCWAAVAISLRRERFPRVATEASTYEQLAELKEGLAQYMQQRALGTLPHLRADADPRKRAYATGAALGIILDRLAPGWQGRIQNSLDELVPAYSGEPCHFSEVEQAGFRERANFEVTRIMSARDTSRREFVARAGWTLTIAATTPLLPQGFDPMNVERLSGSEVLHRRLLKLGNQSGFIEVMNIPALTTSAGAHPLFAGIKTCEIRGIVNEPVVSTTDETTVVSANGITARFKNAEVERDGRSFTVRIK